MVELTFLTAAAAAVETPAAVASVIGWELKDYIGLISAITAIVALVVSYFVSSCTLKASLGGGEPAKRAPTRAEYAGDLKVAKADGMVPRIFFASLPRASRRRHTARESGENLALGPFSQPFHVSSHSPWNRALL